MAKQITIVVPMSGCFMTSAHAAPTTRSSGLAIVPTVRTASGRADRSCAPYRTSETFSSSDGWNWKIPAPTQRVAPFTVTPTPGSITAVVSTNELTSRIGVRPRISRSPCREPRCSSTSPAAPNSM